MNGRYLVEIIIALACSLILTAFFVLAKPIFDSKANNTDLISAATEFNKVIYHEQVNPELPWTITEVKLIEGNRMGVLLQLNLHYNKNNQVPAHEINFSTSLSNQNTYGQTSSIKAGANSIEVLLSVIDKNDLLPLQSTFELSLAFEHIRNNRYAGHVGEIKKIPFTFPVIHGALQ